MIVTVSGATRAITRFLAKHPQARTRVGHMLNPRSGNSMQSLMATGLPLVADNGCFHGLDEPKFIAMLNRIRIGDPYRQRIHWIAVPDKVADAKETWAMWKWYHHHVRGQLLPMAFVAQNDCEQGVIPWSKMDALFIGGSMEWKLGPVAASLVTQAKRMGKWVHVGRVYTYKRINYFASLGADSFDSTYYSRYEERYLKPVLHYLESEQTGFHAFARESSTVVEYGPIRCDDPHTVCPLCRTPDHCDLGYCKGAGLHYACTHTIAKSATRSAARAHGVVLV